MGLAAGMANALLFFMLFVALILAALIVFSYAAYSFLVAFVNTAAGNDEVHWPGDPIQDWFFKLWYFVWLLAFWIVPVSLVLGLLGLPPLRATSIVLAVLWLIFPVSLLSSLSAGSAFVVLRPMIIGRLFRHFGSWAVFYFCTGLLLALCCGLFYQGVLRSGLVLPVAAVFGAVGFFVYARLLGRLALLISQEKRDGRRHGRNRAAGEASAVLAFDPWSIPDETKSQPPIADKRGPPQPPPKRKPKAKASSQVNNPWAMPAEEPKAKAKQPRKVTEPEDPYGPVEGTYDFLTGDPRPPPVAPTNTDWLDIDPTPYAVGAPQEIKPAHTLPQESPEVTNQEAALAAPRRPPAPPRMPLFSGVYTFPFYQTTLAPFLTLSAGFLLMAGLFRLLISFFPT